MEGKGGHAGGRDVIFTKKKKLAALNAPETYFLALLRGGGGSTHSPIHKNRFCTRRSGIWEKAAGDGSNLETAVKVAQNRRALEILVGLRNYATHRSDQSKSAALTAMRHWEPDRHNLGSAGYWLSVTVGVRTRMERLLTDIEKL